MQGTTQHTEQLASQRVKHTEKSEQHSTHTNTNKTRNTTACKQQNTNMQKAQLTATQRDPTSANQHFMQQAQSKDTNISRACKDSKTNKAR